MSAGFFFVGCQTDAPPEWDSVERQRAEQEAKEEAEERHKNTRRPDQE